MPMKPAYSRTPLPEGTVLSLRPEDQPERKISFSIDHPLGQGGSSLVYKATRGDGVYGTLKAFCPAAGAWSPADTRRLQQICAALHRLKRQETLGTFIPYMTLYQGEEEQPWLFTPEDRRGITLAQYLQELPAAPTPEMLFQVLNALHATALAVWQLNALDALLLDIKPDNILLIQRAVPDGGRQYLQDAVSLFDIESLLPDYPTAVAEALLPYSPGFTAPELGSPLALPRRRRIGPSSDVYALGATLLFCLTGQCAPCYGENIVAALRSGPFGTLWQPEDCRRIAGLLGRALEPNAFRRIPDASAFADQLQAVTDRLQNRQSRQKQTRTRQLADTLPQMLSHLLYRWPCQDYAGDGPLRVGLLSDGNPEAVTAALNLLVRSCQVLDRPLQILVVMPGARAVVRGWCAGLYQAETLLQTGEGAVFPPCDPYRYAAQIHWLEEVPEAVVTDRDPALDAIPYWVLLPGDPDTALRWAARWQPGNGPSLMAYPCLQGKTLYADRRGGLTRVALCPAAPDDLFTEAASQVAYRAHALYERERDPYVTEETIRRTFAEGYNQASSLETALAVKCRLFSAGVTWQPDADAMAGAFRAALDADETLLPRLSWLEHRRWALSKLVQGARPLPPEEFSLLLDGGAQQAGTHLRRDGRLYHAYLVPSRWTPRPTGWQTADEWAAQPLDADPPAELDELDRAGLALYRLFARQARDCHPEPLYHLLESQCQRLTRWLDDQGQGAAAQPLRQTLQTLGQALQALQAPEAGPETVAPFGDSLHRLEKLLQAQEGNAPYAAQTRQTAALLEEECFCLVQSRRRIDPKRLDDTLIEHLPLLLLAEE